MNNLDEAKAERLAAMTDTPSREEPLRELRATRESLARLERRLAGDYAER